MLVCAFIFYLQHGTQGEQYDIVPLTEKNYATWKVQMKMYLLRENLFSIVNGTEVAPRSEQSKAAQAFSQRSDRALASIVLAIDPKLLYIVGDPTDPSEVWQKLQDTFQRKTWSNKLRLKKKLYAMKLAPCGSLQPHLKEFVELFDELVIIGDAVEDEDRVFCLLASLPDSYSTMVTALEALDDIPSWEAVVERLLREEEKMAASTSSGSGDRALAAFQASNSDKKPIRKCFECQKPGHIRKDCWVYLKKMKNLSGKNKSPAANSAVTKEDSADGETILIASAFAIKESVTDHWIIDSGAK